LGAVAFQIVQTTNAIAMGLCHTNGMSDAISNPVGSTMGLQGLAGGCGNSFHINIYGAHGLSQFS
jgi:hypothetical protein